MSRSEESIVSFTSAKAEFEKAWRDPNCTQFELPAVDVNKVLKERYTASAPIHVTRTMVWDMELKKAWDPATYIPYVVSGGRSWGRHGLEDGCERFFRSSDQRAWISEDRGRVLEDVFINHAAREIIFLGRAELVADTGERVRARDLQPLFHVEHAAGGSEVNPLNLWRIVVLTAGKDLRFTQPFEQMAAAGLLPEFLEIYIERDLRVGLKRR